MNQTIQAEETLFSAAHPQLYKKISVNQILVSSLIALGGIVAIVIMVLMKESDSTLSMALLTVGILLLLLSIYRFFKKSHDTVYKPTGSTIRTNTLYMDTAELQELLRRLKKNDFSSSSRFAFKEGGNGRMDYMISNDGRFVGVQLYQFVPYTYEPISDKLYYIDDDAVIVANCLGI